jgi:hypothetical protein
MYVSSWIEPHQDQLPPLTLPKNFVALTYIWLEILWGDSEDSVSTDASLPTTSSLKRARDSYLDSASLWLIVKASSDKLFFISCVPAKSILKKWYLLNVLPTTNLQHAKKSGLYSVGWWISQAQYVDTSDKDKKFFPEIHVFHPSSGFGQVLINFWIGQLENHLICPDR